MKTTFKIIGVILAALIFSFYYFFMGSLYFTPPWKVTDPHDSKFVAENFRYEDYFQPEELQTALRAMFPQGTSKAHVTKILYGIQNKKPPGDDGWGASMREWDNNPLGDNVTHFSYMAVPRAISKFVIAVSYDENDRVIEIYEHGIPLFNKNEKAK